MEVVLESVGSQLTWLGTRRGSPDPSMEGGPTQGLLEGDPYCHVKWLHHLLKICHVACLLVGPWIYVQWSFTTGSWSDGGNGLQGSPHGLYLIAQMLVGPWWGRSTCSLGPSKVHFLVSYNQRLIVQVEPVMDEICSCYSILPWDRGMLTVFWIWISMVYPPSTYSNKKSCTKQWTNCSIFKLIHVTFNFRAYHFYLGLE